MKNQFNPVIPVWIMVIVMLLLLGVILYLMCRKKLKKRRIAYTVISLTAVMALTVAMNLRYMTARKDSQAAARNLDVLFVVDNTLSMQAQDTRYGSRIYAARRAASYVMKNLEGANFAVIQFDNVARIISPFTQDADTVNDALSTITEPYKQTATGTHLDQPYKPIEELLLSSAKKENRQAMIFFLSDGENKPGESVGSYEALAQYIKGGAVVGFGSEEGEEVVVREKQAFQSGWKEVGRFTTKLEEASLQKLAGELGLSYVHYSDEHVLDAAIERILQISELTYEKSNAVTYDDTYYIWTVPMLAALFVILALFIRRKRL